MLQLPFKSRKVDAADAATPAVDADERIYAVGDVHGRSDLLYALIEKISIDASQQSSERRLRVVFVGDYIDRGDHSREVIECLILLGTHLGQRVDVLLGNHEVALLGFLEDPLRGQKWLEMGGKQTIASYGITPPSTKPDQVGLVALRDRLHEAMGGHVAFLQSLPRMARSGQVVFVHAGLDPAYPLDAQPDAALLWGQIEGGDTSGVKGYRMVHGHYANYDPVSEVHRICVDTGAYFTGRLTAVRLDDEEAFLHADIDDLMG